MFIQMCIYVYISLLEIAALLAKSILFTDFVNNDFENCFEDFLNANTNIWEKCLKRGIQEREV